MAQLAGPMKLKTLKELMSKLAQDLKLKNLAPDERDAILDQVKVLGRSEKDAEPIFAKAGMETIIHHAFDSTSKSTSRNALKVLCNAMMMRPDTRQIFVDLGWPAKACMKLKSENLEDEFLLSRAIFLTTYGTNVDLMDLIDHHDLADIMIEKLARHAEPVSDTRLGKSKEDPVTDMALAETLKLLFNVTHFCKRRVASLTPAIPHLATLLCKCNSLNPESPLAPPVGLIVNALLNLQLADESVRENLFPKDYPSVFVDKLILLLDVSLATYAGKDLDEKLIPLTGVISTVTSFAPDEILQRIRTKLLPTEESRKDVLGRDSSLPSRLLRTSTNPLAPQLQQTIPHLLFDLSGKDAQKFVENVGYGYASGFLFQNNIAVPESMSQAQGLGAESHGGRAVNPITGQFLDAELRPKEPDLTEEEKERELEKLLILFDRLNKTGVMSVDPAEMVAQHEVRRQKAEREKSTSQRRVQELPDDAVKVEDLN